MRIRRRSKLVKNPTVTSVTCWTWQSVSSVRRSNRIERLLRESKLFMEESLSTLDLKRLPPLAAQQVRFLLEGKFVQRHENVLVFGNPGSGKTGHSRAHWARN